jgi:hypothetical protein
MCAAADTPPIWHAHDHAHVTDNCPIERANACSHNVVDCFANDDVANHLADFLVNDVVADYLAHWLADHVTIFAPNDFDANTFADCYSEYHTDRDTDTAPYSATPHRTPI